MSSKLKQNIIISLFIIILIMLSAYFGFKGWQKSKSEALLNNVNSTRLALDYFFADQGRYPSLQEFSDKNIMNSYFSKFPLPDITLYGCPKSFVYSSSLPSQYTLQFCLSQPVKDLPSGVNTFTN